MAYQEKELLFGIKDEHDAINFYREMMKTALNERERRTFLHILHEEMEHKEKLDKILHRRLHG